MWLLFSCGNVIVLRVVIRWAFGSASVEGE